MHRLSHPLFFILITVLTSVAAYADTFEFLTYTPPSGWTMSRTADGMTYVRSTGVGLIYFYNGYGTNGTAGDEFAKAWRARVEPTVPGAAPAPQIEREGDITVAAGSKQVDAKGTITTIALATFVGRGRAISVLTMAAGEEAQGEATGFLNGLDIVKGATPATIAQASAGDVEVDLRVPAGYMSSRDGAAMLLKPVTLDRNTPCVYGVSAPRPTRGSLEADAKAAVLEPLPGWQIKSERYDAMRGTSGEGWPYFWYRTVVQQMAGNTMQDLSVMTMAFPNGRDRISILWGFGSPNVCTMDDATFLRLFHSLHPRAWTGDGGKALAAELQGMWRDTHGVGIQQYRFLPNGRYEHAIGTSTTFSTLETRTGRVGDGRYSLRGSELTVTADPGGSGGGTFRVAIFDDYLAGVWRRTMSLLNETESPPREVRFMRVEDR